MLGAGLLAALVVLPHFPLQVTNDAIGTSVSFELCFRLAVCAACGIYGLWHLARSARRLEKFPLAWCVLFGAWSMFSLFAAADLRVGTVACGVFWCTLLFLPAVVRNWARSGLCSSSWQRACSTLADNGRVPRGFRARIERGGFGRRRGLSPRRRFAGFGLSRRPSRRADARAGASPFASPTLVDLGRGGNHVGRHKKPHGRIRNGRRVRPLLLRQMDPRHRRVAVLGAAAVAMAALVLLGNGLFDVRSDAVASALARTGDADEIWSASGRSEISAASCSARSLARRCWATATAARASPWETSTSSTTCSPCDTHTASFSTWSFPRVGSEVCSWRPCCCSSGALDFWRGPERPARLRPGPGVHRRSHRTGVADAHAHRTDHCLDRGHAMAECRCALRRNQSASGDANARRSPAMNVAEEIRPSVEGSESPHGDAAGSRFALPI